MFWQGFALSVNVMLQQAERTFQYFDQLNYRSFIWGRTSRPPNARLLLLQKRWCHLLRIPSAGQLVRRCKLSACTTITSISSSPGSTYVFLDERIANSSRVQIGHLVLLIGEISFYFSGCNLRKCRPGGTVDGWFRELMWAVIFLGLLAVRTEGILNGTAPVCGVYVNSFGILGSTPIFLLHSILFDK